MDDGLVELVGVGVVTLGTDNAILQETISGGWTWTVTVL